MQLERHEIEAVEYGIKQAQRFTRQWERQQYAAAIGDGETVARLGRAMTKARKWRTYDYVAQVARLTGQDPAAVSMPRCIEILNTAAQVIVDSRVTLAEYEAERRHESRVS